jgi:hypothetical protein
VNKSKTDCVLPKWNLRFALAADWLDSFAGFFAALTSLNGSESGGAIVTPRDSSSLPDPHSTEAISGERERKNHESADSIQKTIIRLLLVALALACFALSLGIAWGQSRPDLQTKQRGILGLNNLLGLRPAQRPTAQSRKVLQQDAVALGLAKAKVYKFATADYPGASQSVVFDNEGGTAIGTFTFDPSTSPLTAFTFHAGVYEILSVPNSLASILTGMNGSGQLVGAYADLASVVHGFLDNAGTFSDIDFPSATDTEALDINDSGQIVGVYTDLLSNSHGFLDNGGVFTSIDFPGADSTTAAGINSAGDIVGVWQDATFNSHGFLLRGGVFTTFDFPLATGTTAFGINDSGDIAGFFIDAGSVAHGFIFSRGAFTQVDVAGATDTQLTRINNKGQLAGVFTDVLTGQHGLTAH